MNITEWSHTAQFWHTSRILQFGSLACNNTIHHRYTRKMKDWKTLITLPQTTIFNVVYFTITPRHTAAKAKLHRKDTVNTLQRTVTQGNEGHWNPNMMQHCMQGVWFLGVKALPMSKIWCNTATHEKIRSMWSTTSPVTRPLQYPRGQNSKSSIVAASHVWRQLCKVDIRNFGTFVKSSKSKRR